MGVVSLLVFRLARVRIGHGRLCEDGEHFCEAAVGNPDLGAVQDVMLSVGRELRAGTDGAGVAAGARLRESKRCEILARDESREVPLLLLFVA